MSIKHSFGNLPKDFFILTLDEISEKITDGTHSTPTYVEKGGVPFYSVENVVANNFTKTKLIPHELHEKLCSRIQPKKGDLLLTRIGSVGKTKLIDWEVNASIYVSLALIRLQKNINKEYVYQFTKSDFFQQEIKKRSLLNATPMKINLGEIGKIPVPFPSCIIEQQKIAEVLSTVDKKIDLIDQKITETEKLKTGLMQKLFSEGVGVQDENGNWQPHTEFQDSPFGKVPSSWALETLEQRLDVIKDGTHFSPKSKEGPCKYLTSKNIRFGELDLTNISYISQEEHDRIYKGSPVKYGDILLTKDGANTGNAAINTLEEPFSLLSSVAYLRGSEEDVDHGYLLQLLLSPKGQSMMKSAMAGQAITRLTLKKIGAFVLPFAPIDEQNEIERILSTVDKKLQLLKKQKAETQQLKKGLMQKLLTGEWRVPVEEIEAA